jgi:hypothetical protein
MGDAVMVCCQFRLCACNLRPCFGALLAHNNVLAAEKRKTKQKVGNYGMSFSMAIQLMQMNKSLIHN